MTALLLPRGVRGNNPGNIRHSKDKWQGTNVEQVDDEFVTFESPVMGLRCMIKILLNYYSKYNLKTVEQMINKWAPPNENNSKAYADSVAAHMDVKKTEPLVITEDSIIKMLEAMVIVENGSPKSFPAYIHRELPYWYPRSVYEAAWNGAVSK